MPLAEAPLDALSREQKLLLLKRLRAKLKALAATLAAKQGLGGAAAAPAADASTDAEDAEAVSPHPPFLPRSLAVHEHPVLQHIEMGFLNFCCKPIIPVAGSLSSLVPTSQCGMCLARMTWKHVAAKMGRSLMSYSHVHCRCQRPGRR